MIDPFYFILGLLLGLLYNYLEQGNQIVYKYPNPDNAGSIVYKDNAGVCYKYRANKVTCPNNQAKQTIPT